MNPIALHRRHFEDLGVGEVVVLGPVTVTKAMIIAFAQEFDPFPFHLDEAAAKKSLLGGLSASGWQTAALTLRMLVDAFLSGIASMGGLGFSDLKWIKPVMAGDAISGTARLAELRRSRSHPDRGIIRIAIEMKNGRGQPVMRMTLANMVAIRDPDAGLQPALVQRDAAGLGSSTP